MRDTVGLVLLEQGKDPANFTDADFDAAIAMIQKAKDAGQITGFTGNDYTERPRRGDIAACVAWTGDVVQLQADNPDARLHPARDRAHPLVRQLRHPDQAKHKKNAEVLINYYYDPAVMAQVEDYVNYIAPVQGAKEALTKSDPDVANNPLIFPSRGRPLAGPRFRGLTAAEETKYAQKFSALTGGC